ncbi:DNA (cytosine-5-)-methyltransferase [Helicobacter bilis]|uniref:DNA (cytosine-5-)-methyltransferase n=1 Tax=Helicobacter bilis TaxID=37372 RepID=UPI00248DEB81|nr:DNA (cytosine-5-)-methyltransferase [Helicobacter bilis]
MGQKMTFIDFCSGIGGGRLGLESCGLKCLGFSEIDRAAIKTYKTFFNTSNELELGDLTQINPQSLPDFDLLVSGFPCQSFSIVGKREGLENKEKGQIIFYLAEILKAKQPSFFILENVKGLLNHNKGQTLKEILKLLESCGYQVFHKLLNSLDFALAQARERVYFVGIRKDKKRDFSFSQRMTKKALKEFLTPKQDNIFSRDSQSYQTFLRFLENKYNKGRFDLTQILDKDFLVLDTRQSDLRLYENKIPTLRRDRQGLFYVFNKKLYRLSGLEALRLQGFEKVKKLESKIKHLSQNDILRQCGNAMSVNVIESIAKDLLCNDGKGA